ncbi:MAG: hypothetical protein KatS3mg077_2060 [Candidatus Binatia bacterium]|nr:MAG: hypothetical protein KatS3mg077_2060 [Candidatus Binatia bacterium]
MARMAERTLWGLGALLFLALVYRFGWADLVSNLRAVGWGIVLVIGQEILAFAANTAGWRSAFPQHSPIPPFGMLLRARLAGDAINYVTPTATVGGEFVRLEMLAGRSARIPVAASLTVAKLAQTLGQVVFIAAGLAIVAAQFSLPHAVRWSAWASVSGVVVACTALVWWQRRGMFTPLLRLVQSAGWLRAPHWAEHIARLDAEIRSLHGQGSRMALSVVAFAIGWALGVVEMYIVLWLLGVPPTWSLALAIEVFSATLDGILFFVPAKLGTQEGGKVFIFALLGLDPAKGLAAGVLRRIRELFWVAVGLAVWWRAQWNANTATAAPLHS